MRAILQKPLQGSSLGHWLQAWPRSFCMSLMHMCHRIVVSSCHRETQVGATIHGHYKIMVAMACMISGAEGRVRALHAHIHVG